jgi:hypothetical protein
MKGCGGRDRFARRAQCLLYALISCLWNVT